MPYWSIMRNKHPCMKLCLEEESFRRHWMFDEVHYQDEQGPAKRLQIAKQVSPADLAVLIAAGLPDLADQEAAGQGPPPVTEPVWPWTEQTLRSRLDEARAMVAGGEVLRNSGSR